MWIDPAITWRTHCDAGVISQHFMAVMSYIPIFGSAVYNFLNLERVAFPSIKTTPFPLPCISSFWLGMSQREYQDFLEIRYFDASDQQ